MLRASLLLCSFVALVPRAAAAQTDPEPIPRVAADVRVAVPRFKANPLIASSLAVNTVDLPTRGWGWVAGAHLYPLRAGKVTFGFGAEILRSGASSTREPADEEDPAGPTVRTRLSAISPQLSFNFGHRDGWSYISGGMGWASLTSEVQTTASDGAVDSARRKAINYGGGARWFATEHLAVSLDLRFYAVSPRVATATEPAYPRMTVMVLTGGIGFR